jgi:hypothetical protein
MGQLESKIEQDICEFAKRHDWLVRKLSWIGRRGAPDRLFIRKGVAIFAEIKQRGKRATVQQEREHKRLRDQGMLVHVWDNVNDAFEILE